MARSPKYIGDGVLAYFGYPEAHEEDAERAVRAGLHVIDAISAIHLRTGIRPRVRIGVATGLVVVGELVGEGSAQERLAVGETLNLAARLQGAASPNCLVVAESTRRLAGAAFSYDDLGRHELKGVPGGVRLWRVLGESRARGRFDVRIVTGLTPFVGRGEEIGLLRRRWECAKDGGDRSPFFRAGRLRKVADRSSVRRRVARFLDYFDAIFWLTVSCRQPVLSLHKSARVGRRHSEN
jgi:hypothetical protein